MARKDDIRDQPAYTLAEAARYLKVAPATLRSWVIGRPYPAGKGLARSRPLIRPASNPPPMLSFWNLIEAHVLRSLRTDHGVPFRDAQVLMRADRESRGRLIESPVGAHLANAAAAGECELFYWRDRGQEVDFVVRSRKRPVAHWLGD